MNYIISRCGEDGPTEIDTKDIDIIDIEEGPQGEDIITWKCDSCKKEHKSTVYRSRGNYR